MPTDLVQPEFGLRLGRDDGVAQLAVRGEIDLATAPFLDDAFDLLDLQGEGEIRLSLAEVSFIDSSGLQSLVTGHRRLAADGRRLVITEVPPRLWRLLRVSGLDRVLTLR